MTTRVVGRYGTFPLQAKSRLIMTVHPREERVKGEEDIIEVSEMIYGTVKMDRGEKIFLLKNSHKSNKIRRQQVENQVKRRHFSAACF